jgi:preprotein translocase subunit SecB
VKDFSFENPERTAIYQQTAPDRRAVQHRLGQVGDDVYEVVLKIEVKAEPRADRRSSSIFPMPGLFGMRNVPDEQMEPFLLGEAPRCSSRSPAACSPMPCATAASRR